MSEFQVPHGLLGSERDPEPWELWCNDHGLQTGRLVNTPNLEASSLGVCEVCLTIHYVRCKTHGIVERTDRGGCAHCFASGQRDVPEPSIPDAQAQPAVAPSPPAPPLAGAVSPISLPSHGMDPLPPVLAVSGRTGPAPFGGFADGDSGGSEAGAVLGGAGNGNGDPPAYTGFTLEPWDETEGDSQTEGQPGPPVQPLPEIRPPAQGLSDLALSVRRAIDTRSWRSLGRERGEAADPAMNDSEGA